ncbi:MAG: T9SS type A sorting domain-containing protein [Ignavibacteria bacterium]|nr:T9SS type A sorting domain-containing protein [Ignavibacteria bacterium]
MIKKILLLSIVISTGYFISFGWGKDGHQLVNRKVTEAFPAQMNYYKAWQAQLISKASDADNRKQQDKTEAPRHYIDIDSYPEFLQFGYINQNYDTVVAQHGATFVGGQGILPWAILKWTDSLTALLRVKDTTRAIQVAADLGHYVGDGHMPLHITDNYDGDATNQSGVHSRYESTMMSKYASQIVFTPATAQYITNKSDFVFNFLYEDYKFKDSVLYADSVSKAVNGNSYNGKYVDTLWARTRYFTAALIQHASERLASLIYTAWVDAGKPFGSNAVTGEANLNSRDFRVDAYPNPFNAQVRISVSLPASALQNGTAGEFKVYSITGQLVKTKLLSRDDIRNGSFAMDFTENTSGIYIGVLRAGNYVISKKLSLLK